MVRLHPEEDAQRLNRGKLFLHELENDGVQAFYYKFVGNLIDFDQTVDCEPIKNRHGLVVAELEERLKILRLALIHAHLVYLVHVYYDARWLLLPHRLLFHYLDWPFH